MQMKNIHTQKLGKKLRAAENIRYPRLFNERIIECFAMLREVIHQDVIKILCKDVHG